VDISAALAADLVAVALALDQGEVELQTQLQELAAAVKSAVASYLAMTMTIALDEHDVRVTVHDDAATPTPKITTSLLIPLSAVAAAYGNSTLVLYAATPGAFVDLAADLSHALGTDPAALILDSHPVENPDRDGDGMAGLDALVTINQAIGVLIGRGHTPGFARQELHRLAALNDGDLHATAQQIVLLTGNGPSQEA
jgi:hypothetical protein